MKQIFTALSFIHDKHVIHRDMKLANIMKSDKDGKYYIIDFGIARLLESYETHGKTLIGTPLYMAVEHQMGKTTYKSDIYSVGLCVLALLFGDQKYLVKNALVFIRESLEKIQDDKELSNFLLHLTSDNEYDRPTAKEALQIVKTL